MFDFHFHTFHSDGELSPVELIRRAHVNGYRVLGVADHVGPGNCADVIRQVTRDCELCSAHWPILALSAVEITHVPPNAIAGVARLCREAGAKVIAVHGETPNEPVEPGTNYAAVTCPDVDILAHPGFISLEEARLAARNGVFIELTPRRGHCLTNGHVARVGRDAGARFLVNSDGHAPGDFLSTELARKVIVGAGLDDGDVVEITERNPRRLLEKLGLSVAE